MRIFKSIILVVITTFSLLFSGCGGGSTSSITDLKGQLVDSNISGVDYITNSGKTGVTDANGYFAYSASDTNISFSIGSLKLPDFNLSAINSDGMILPSDLVGVDRNNSTDANVSKLLRVFQSLDDDGNPSNGINITQATKDDINITQNLLDLNISEINTTIIATGKTLKSELVVRTHFEETLRSLFSLDVDTVAPTTPTLTSDTNTTQATSTTVEVNGEVGAKIFVDGVDTNQTIGSSGKTNISIDTTAIVGNSDNFIITLKDSKNNISNTLTFTVTKTKALYIKSAVYDNNSTATPNDDKLYIYFNKSIDENDFSVSDKSTLYDLNGTGAIGSSSTSNYNDNLFYRHTLSLNSEGTTSAAIESNSTNISIKRDTISDTDGNYPEDLNQTLVKKFNTLARLKTGQTTSYVANDDGDTQRGIARSYTDNGDTVTDNATGLIWQQEDDNTKRNWADSITYCEGITLDGNSDFRLPTIDELMSVTDKELLNPAINTIFTGTNSSEYWSATTKVSNSSGDIWTVHFYDGGTSYFGIGGTLYVRCVRSADN